jgi:hypothetical protein
MSLTLIFDILLPLYFISLYYSDVIISGAYFDFQILMIFVMLFYFFATDLIIIFRRQASRRQNNAILYMLFNDAVL